MKPPENQKDYLRIVTMLVMVTISIYHAVNTKHHMTIVLESKRSVWLQEEKAAKVDLQEVEACGG